MSFKRPTDANGNEMITVEELAEITGLSCDHIRDRARGVRGKKIPNIKIGKRIYFAKDEAVSSVYGTSCTPNIEQDSVSWL